MPNEMSEPDLRLEVLDQLLTTPHRALDKIWPLHVDLAKKDPRFYVQMAAWYADHGDVRDHREMFIINLILSKFPGHRDVGLAMFRELPPHQVMRVIDYISGRKKTRRLNKSERQRALENVNQKGRRRKIRKLFEKNQAEPQSSQKDLAASLPKTTVESTGLFLNLPRSLKTEVARYLREREADDRWFDSSVLIARKAMKRLYALCHVRPCDRAQKILFDNQPPPDSTLYALRQLTQANSPADQAQAIVTHKIPYRVASTVVRQMTPAVLAALIHQMSPQDLINNLGSLKRRGAMDHAAIKTMIDEKLMTATKARNVSAFKATRAAEAVELSDDVRDALDNVADQQIKAKGRITRSTALLIDKSASMEMAIELGKRIGAMLSTVCENDLFVYAFDTVAYPIQPAGSDLADWNQAMLGIEAGGATSCGIGVASLTRSQQVVEQIIMITDEGHNTPPALLKSIQAYTDTVGHQPNLVLVRTPGGCNALEQMCRRNDQPVDVFCFDGDYYSLPNMIPMLARPSKSDLLAEIVSYPLPKRKGKLALVAN